MAVLTGLVDTTAVLGDERIVDMDEEIKMLDPSVAQFMVMLEELGSRNATREQINWLEDDLRPRLSALAASATSGATTVTVTTNQGAFFRPRDVVRVGTTGEAFLVSSISTDTLTIVRGLGGTGAASAASGVDLLVVGNAAVQGATLGTRIIQKKVLGYNYTQIQRDPFGFTGTEANIDTYGGPAPLHEEVKKLTEHKRAIESTLFWGPRAFTTNAPNSVGYCGGAYEFITTNVHNAAGSLTHLLADTYLQQDLQHGSQHKVLFVAPIVARAMSGFLKTAYAPVSVDTKRFGAVINAYISGAYGTEIPVVVKREWQDYSTSSTQFGGYAFLIDMDYVTFRPLRNRNTQLLRNRQAPDADEETHEYRTEFSLEFVQEKCHAVWKGITG